MAGYADEDLIPIAALQHHLFCPRQCALIHVDGLWSENRLTAEGRVLHERSDTPGRRSRRNPSDERTRVIFGMPLVHRGLGLTGKADQVERPVDASGAPDGPPRPIEHKRGSPKRLDHDRVQVAAQAVCLEEMFGVEIKEGELFYHAVRRRERVVINAALRALVERVTGEIRENIRLNRIPRVKRQPKCRSCSLLNLCMPGATGPGRDPGRYLSRSLAASLERDPRGEEPHA